MKLRNSVLLILFVLLLTSCGTQLTRQGPKRRKADRFYRLTDKKGVIFHQRCKNIKKNNRKCSISEYDLLKQWDFFRGEFILIPQKYVFP